MGRCQIRVLSRVGNQTACDVIELTRPDAGPDDLTQSTSDPAEVGTIFRDAFAAIGSDSPPPGNTFDMAERRRQDERVAAISRLPGSVGPCGETVMVGEVRACIGELKFGKASGPDLISTDLLKVLVDNDTVLESLALILNQCLELGRNPADWTVARVTCLYKKGDRQAWENYRLISLLSVVGKLYEKVLARRLSAFLDGAASPEGHAQGPAAASRPALLSQCQGGFRKYRRCADQAAILVEAVKLQARRGRSTYTVFLDVRKAYPTVRRSGMLERLFDKLVAGDPTRMTGASGRAFGRRLPPCYGRRTVVPRW